MTQSVLLAREHFSIHILPSLSSLYSSTGGNMRLSFLHVIGTKPNLFCMIVFFETLFCMIVTCKELEQVYTNLFSYGLSLAKKIVICTKKYILPQGKNIFAPQFVGVSLDVGTLSNSSAGC